MRTPLKLFHNLLAWGMVPLFVWSGFPSLGCPCASESVDSAPCGCCAPEKTPTKKSCCCQGKEHGKHLATASIGSVIPPSDPLASCDCGRTVPPWTTSGEQDRKTIGEHPIAQDDDVVALVEPDPPFSERVGKASALRMDFDRVILFRALLI